MQNNSIYIVIGFITLGVFMYILNQQEVDAIAAMERKASYERDQILCKLDENCEEDSLEDLIQQLRSE